MITLEETRDKIIEWAEDKKAEDVIAIDVQGKTSYTDIIIVCHGSNELHLKAIADNICDNAKKEKIYYLSVEGKDNAAWILIDFVDIIVHIFRESTRKYYKIEDLWKVKTASRKENSNDKE
jgi:ribosome-associated protein